MVRIKIIFDKLNTQVQAEIFVLAYPIRGQFIEVIINDILYLCQVIDIYQSALSSYSQPEYRVYCTLAPATISKGSPST